MVLHQKGQSTKNLGQFRGEDVGGIRRKRMSDFPCYDSIVQRSTQKQKGHGKLSIHFAATHETIETMFCSIVSANQLSLYGAVAAMCEEYESLHDRSGRPDMVLGQSIVLNAIKTEVSLDCDDPTNQNLLLRQYGERIEKLSQKDKLSKFCMDVGFSECC